MGVSGDVIIHRLKVVKKSQNSEVEKEKFCARKIRSDQERVKNNYLMWSLSLRWYI